MVDTTSFAEQSGDPTGHRGMARQTGDRSSMVNCHSQLPGRKSQETIYHWIGLRENLQETMVFTTKYGGFL